ncbi:putative cyclin-D7-1 [Humulus lupulus]|uniref:putative cyclin-D7-1 n=1 Tax=Humulus lupulus TaxID=3486 RepID=UPI002B400EEF|nr:putative cyclin-D7-1 [Humulus lupulus]
MDHISLFCDEVWPSSPTAASDDIGNNIPVQMTEHVITTKRCSFESHDDNNGGDQFHITTEDSEVALTICLEKEKTYVPEPKYSEYLESKNLIVARFRTIQWFIKCRSRFNLSFGTVFHATNYLDRFISINQNCIITEWKYWMVELLSIACFSIASKFIDTNPPMLHEINQMEDIEHSFEASAIQRMELKVLVALDWRLACTTAHSYLQLFTPHLQYYLILNHQQHIIIPQINHLLLRVISDTELVEFRPSVVAASAIWCCLDRFLSTPSTVHQYSHLTRFFHQPQKDDIIRCHNMMEERSTNDGRIYLYDYNNGCPSSPTTVLLKDRNNIICDDELSPFLKCYYCPNPPIKKQRTL